MPVIVKSIRRTERALVAAYRGIGVATVHECIGRETANAMDAGIKPLAPEMRISGPAITVECFPNDNSTVHVAMTLCKPGDVLVVNGHGVASGMLGAQMAYQCVLKKLGGLVIDGGVRDSTEIKRMGFPCFSRHVNPQGTGKGTLGSINVPIQCGGVSVSPGDLVLGDEDGVVVVPRARAKDVLARSRERDKKEKAERALYRQGKNSVELLGLGKLLEGKNVVVMDKKGE